MSRTPPRWILAGFEAALRETVGGATERRDLEGSDLDARIKATAAWAYRAAALLASQAEHGQHPMALGSKPGCAEIVLPPPQPQDCQCHHVGQTELDRSALAAALQRASALTRGEA